MQRNIECKWILQDGSRAAACEGCHDDKKGCRVDGDFPPRKKDGKVVYARKRIKQEKVSAENVDSRVLELLQQVVNEQRATWELIMKEQQSTRAEITNLCRTIREYMGNEGI
jgi:hypothetical protein